MDNTVIKQVETAMQDELFVQNLVQLENAEDVQTAFAEKGIHFSLDEIKQIGMALTSVDGGELSEDALDNVAGGIALTTIAAVISTSAALIKLGTAIKQGTW